MKFVCKCHTVPEGGAVMLYGIVVGQRRLGQCSAVSSTPPIIQFGALASMNDLSHMTSVDLIVGLKLSPSQSALSDP